MWEWLFQFTDGFEKVGIPYAIVGSVASSVYGEPRATNDVDVVIQLAKEDATKLARAFPEEQFYVPPTEVIVIELSRGHGAHLNVIALETMAKADLYPLADAEKAWFAKRRSVTVAGRSIWLAAPESVILYKLRYFREGGAEKHLRDIRGILAVSGATIDRDAIARACEQLALTAEWKRVTQDT
jgi:hypothetical protein